MAKSIADFDNNCRLHSSPRECSLASFTSQEILTRFALRAAALTVIAGLTATVILVRPGSETVAAAAQPAVDEDLALVPTDAVGFIHVRAADLWKNDIFAGFRQTFERAGPKALTALDAQFVPKISTFDRATVFVLIDERQRPLPYLVLRFTAPFNPTEVVDAYLPNAAKTNHGGKTVYHGERGDFELYFPDNKHIMVSPPDAMIRYIKHESPKSGAMSYGLKLAASGKPVVGSVNGAALPIPPRELEMLPAEARPLIKAEHVTISLDLAAGAKIDLVGGYKNEADAEAAEKAIKALAEFAERNSRRSSRPGKKLSIRRCRGRWRTCPRCYCPSFRSEPSIRSMTTGEPGRDREAERARNSASVTLPKELVAGGRRRRRRHGVLMPAVAKVRVAAAKMVGQNNPSRSLSLASTTRYVWSAPHDIVDKNGKPLLSWRVAILPFIEQDNLYKQFRLDEPWTASTTSHSRMSRSRSIWLHWPTRKLPPGMTHYRRSPVPAPFSSREAIEVSGDIPDGTSNTILVVEAGDPIPWPSPATSVRSEKAAEAVPGVADIVNIASATAPCGPSIREGPDREDAQERDYPKRRRTTR